MIRTLAFLLALLSSPVLAQDASPVHDKPLSVSQRAQAVAAKNGMVVAQEAMAAQIGVDILKAGGNAVDAAVATGFALAGTYPRAGNIGGGGFMVIWLAKPRKAIAIDYREMAPGGIDKDSFLDDAGNADPQKSLRSGLGVGVPGKAIIIFSLAVKALFVLLTFVGYASLWGAIAADTGASLLVVGNGLRLLRSGT